MEPLTEHRVSAPHPGNGDRRFRFGEFELDCEARRLTLNDSDIKLQDKPFRILELLLANPGKIVKREELRRNLWPTDEFGDFEAGLNTAIRKLRASLQDEPKAPSYIETVQRYGYRFIAPVERVGPTDSEPTDTSSEPVATPNTPERGRSRWFSKSFLAPSAIVAIAGALVSLITLNVAGLRDRLFPRPVTPRIKSIVVLPLENLSGDSSQEYFADGMTEVIITDLGKISELRVISRTSAMHYKGTHKSIPEIARDLNVEAVLEGSVIRSGGQVRVTAQLIDAKTDRHIWSETYRKDLRDLLELQDELSRSIATQVQMRLLPDEKDHANRRQIDPEAYEDYLRGRYEGNIWTPENLKRSVAYFRAAVQKDPSYAAAWAGMAGSYSLLGNAESLPLQTVIDEVRVDAQRAISLDENLSEAHLALSHVWFWEHSWLESEKELQRAIQLNPNNASAHQYYGYLLGVMGRFDRAIAEMKKALELDPLAFNKVNSLSAMYFHAGRYDEALAEMKKIPDPDFNSSLRHRRMAFIYEHQGLLREAALELATSSRMDAKEDLASSFQKRVASQGYWPAKRIFLRDEIQQDERLIEKGSRRPAMRIANNYAELGEDEKAFEWLDRSFREGDLGLYYLKVNPWLAPLRSDPRFQNLARRMNLP
jgi:TolB-like protein/DNA-binding winged helix-turn-helix (wHTH) protein/Tfp pilus assembly protein PilF